MRKFQAVTGRDRCLFETHRIPSIDLPWARDRDAQFAEAFDNARKIENKNPPQWRGIFFSNVLLLAQQQNQND